MSKCGVDPELLSTINACIVCMRCGSVPYEPYKCKSCHKLIGKECYERLKKKACSACSKGELIPFIGAKKLINEMQITHIPCNKQMKFEDYKAHVANCNEKKAMICQNELCNAIIKSDPYVVRTTNGDRLIACSLLCMPKIEIQEILKKRVGKSAIAAMKEIGPVLDEAYTQNEKSPIIKAESDLVLGLCSFVWSNALAPEINLEAGGEKCILNEASYLFRSIIADQPFKIRSVYYWEIHGNAQTENEMKIGVTTNNKFSSSTAFCDHDFGFAYYGTGQLRNGSNSSGNKYGKAFKSAGILGICLNMFEGTLSFALDGEYFGVAFKSDVLKNPPIWPAVSLLHKAICEIKTGLSLPSYFQK